MEKRTIPLNIMLTPEERKDLKVLADALVLTMSMTVRNLIRNAHLMQIRNVPSCASGKPCPMPQFHINTSKDDPNSHD